MAPVKPPIRKRKFESLDGKLRPGHLNAIVQQPREDEAALTSPPAASDYEFRRLVRAHRPKAEIQGAVGPGGVNARCPRGRTALHNAISIDFYNDSIGSRSLLAEDRTREGKERHARELETARALIEMKANVNIHDKSGFTPLHRAILSGNPKLVQLLDEKGKGACRDDILASFNVIIAEIKGREEINWDIDMLHNLRKMEEYRVGLPVRYEYLDDIDTSHQHLPSAILGEYLASVVSNVHLPIQPFSSSLSSSSSSFSSSSSSSSVSTDSNSRHALEMNSWHRDVELGIKGFIEAERKLWADLSKVLPLDDRVRQVLIYDICANLDQIANTVCIKSVFGGFASPQMLTVRGVFVHIEHILHPISKGKRDRLWRDLNYLQGPTKDKIKLALENICGYFSDAMIEVLQKLEAAKKWTRPRERGLLAHIDLYRMRFDSLKRSRPRYFFQVIELTTVCDSLHQLLPTLTEINELFKFIAMYIGRKFLKKQISMSKLVEDWCGENSTYFSSDRVIDALYALATLLNIGANPFSSEDLFAMLKSIITNLTNDTSPKRCTGDNIVSVEAQRWFENKLLFCCLQNKLPNAPDSILNLILNLAGKPCSCRIIDPRHLGRSKAICMSGEIGKWKLAENKLEYRWISYDRNIGGD